MKKNSKDALEFVFCCPYCWSYGLSVRVVCFPMGCPWRQLNFHLQIVNN